MTERITVNSNKPVSIKENLISHKRKTDFRSNSSPVNRILYLQRTIGNQAVQRLIKSGALQAKLRIGQPGDIYEQEADRVAEQVMRMPEPQVQQQSEEEEEEEEETIQTELNGSIQRQPEEEEGEELVTPKVQEKLTMGSPGDVYEQEADRIAEAISTEGDLSDLSNMTSVQQKILSSLDPHALGGLTERTIKPIVSTDTVGSKKLSVNRKQELPPQGDGSVPASIESRILQSKGGGNPLPQHMQNYMAIQAGYDFSNVRVKADSEAAELNSALGARAFTNGSDIWLGGGEKVTDVKLMAHELTHVVQQEGARRIQPQSNSFSLTMASKGFMPKFMQTLTKNAQGNSALFQKGILQFAKENPSENMMALQSKILENSLRGMSNLRENAQTLRGCIPSCTGSSGTTSCSSSATGVKLGRATTINDGTIWGMSVPIIVRGTNLSKVDDSESVSASLNHKGCFKDRPSTRSNNSGWMKADSIPPDRHASSIADHLSYFDRHGIGGSYDRLQMDLFKIPSCGINTPQAIPNSGYRLRRALSPAGGKKVKATITKTAEAVSFGGFKTSSGLTSKREKPTIIRN